MTNPSTPGPESEDWRGMTPRDRGISTPMVDEVFELLADWRRREVCRYFDTNGTNSAQLETLAPAVARRVTGADLEPSETSEEAIEEALVEKHLPMLDQAGILDFDSRSRSVRYWGHPTVEKWAEHAEAVIER